MKNPNLGRNQKENNPMFGKSHSESTKQLMSHQQSLRMDELRKVVYSMRKDQLENKIRSIVKQVINEHIGSMQTTQTL